MDNNGEWCVWSSNELVMYLDDKSLNHVLSSSELKFNQYTHFEHIFYMCVVSDTKVHVGIIGLRSLPKYIIDLAYQLYAINNDLDINMQEYLDMMFPVDK